MLHFSCRLFERAKKDVHFAHCHTFLTCQRHSDAGFTSYLMYQKSRAEKLDVKQKQPYHRKTNRSDGSKASVVPFVSSFRRRAVSEQRSCEFQRTADHKRHKRNRKRSVSGDCFATIRRPVYMYQFLYFSTYCHLHPLMHLPLFLLLYLPALPLLLLLQQLLHLRKLLLFFLLPVLHYSLL